MLEISSKISKPIIMNNIYEQIDKEEFSLGAISKLFLTIAGVKPELVKNIPYEASAQRLIGGCLFFVFLAMLAGQIYFYFSFQITFSSFLIGIAITVIVVLMSILFFRYFNNNSVNIWVSIVLMLSTLCIYWILLIPISISTQKDEIKKGFVLFKLSKADTIENKYLKDSTLIVESDDSSGIRKKIGAPIQLKIDLAIAYLDTRVDSVRILTQQANDLQNNYSTNKQITKLLSDSIKRIQQKVSNFERLRADKKLELKSIDDSLVYIKLIYLKDPKDETYNRLQKYLNGRRNELQLEIYKQRNESKQMAAPIVKLSDDLQKYLVPGKNYNLITSNLNKLEQSKADAEASLNGLRDSLELIYASEKIDRKISDLKIGRDSALNRINNLPNNWWTIMEAIRTLNMNEPDFKSKFFLFSLIWVLPIVLIFLFALFRTNSYREVYWDYIHIQQKKARSFINLEELRYSNIELEKRLNELQGKSTSKFEMAEPINEGKLEDYYYSSALKQKEIAKQTKSTSYYDFTILDDGIANINKAIGLAPNRSEFWELKSKLLYLDDQISESQTAAEKFKELRTAELFQNNIDKKIWLDEIEVEGLPFFGSFSWRLNPTINILLGRNGYGKSHLLSIICAMLKNDYTQSEKLSRINFSKIEDRYIKLYLQGDFKTDNDLISNKKAEIKELQSLLKSENETDENKIKQLLTYKESIRKKKLEIEVEEGMIMLTASEIVSGKGQIPILAIPDMRFVNKAKDYTDGNISDLLKGDEYLKNTSYHFINQEPFESVLQNLLNILGISYFENNKSFDAYIFKIVSQVFLELTGSKFNWNNCEADPNGSYKITVITEGSSTPLAIQKISQGTFSVLSMVGLIYLFLKKKYPSFEDKEIVLQQAIIIIDEIDAHLHPLWQQKIVNIIRGIFANCQFIITAHSPMVVAGCKEDEVSVMRDNRDDENNMIGFTVYQFKEDFIGTSIEMLYSKIFGVEEKDQQYLRYTAMQPFVKEMAEEKLELERKLKTETLTTLHISRLKQLSEDLYYSSKLNGSQDGKRSITMLESENYELKITIQSLEQKILKLKNESNIK